MDLVSSLMLQQNASKDYSISQVCADCREQMMASRGSDEFSWATFVASKYAQTLWAMMGMNEVVMNAVYCDL